MRQQHVGAALALVAFVAIGSIDASAQITEAGTQALGTVPALAAQIVNPVPTPAPTPTLGVRRPIERWFDVQTASLLARYRMVETSAGVTSTSQTQGAVAVKARFKADQKARLTLNIGIATGDAFTSGWNNTGIGTGDRTNTLSVRQLYVAGVPAKGVEASYGGLAFSRGESTEVTGYDNDGYLLGARLSVKRPTQFFFDELSFTNGYLGDTTRPSFFDRASHVDNVNYRQGLVSKKVQPWMTVSADYTWLPQASTWRAAVAAKTKLVRIVDVVRYEQYRRNGPSAASGFSAYGEKGLAKRVTVGAGYASVDFNYGGLNGDRFNRGKRWFETATVKLTRELAAQIWMTQAVDNAFAVSNAKRVEVIVTYNVLASLQRTGLFRQ